MEEPQETLQRSLPGKSAFVQGEPRDTLRASRLEQSLSGTSKLINATLNAAKLETFRTASVDSAGQSFEQAQSKASKRTLPGESFSLSGTSTFVLPEVETASICRNEASASSGSSSRFAEELEELRQILAKETVETDYLVEEELEVEASQLTVRLKEAILPTVGLGIGVQSAASEAADPERAQKLGVKDLRTSPVPLSEDLYDSSRSAFDSKPKGTPPESSLSDASWADSTAMQPAAGGATLDYSFSATGSKGSCGNSALSWTFLSAQGEGSLSLSQTLDKSISEADFGSTRGQGVDTPAPETSVDGMKLEAFKSAVKGANGLGEELRSELLELLRDMPSEKEPRQAS